MYFIDSIESSDGATVVSGWVVDGKTRVVAASFEDGQNTRQLTGFGLPSPDLAESYGKEHGQARFSLSIPGESPEGFIVFTLSDARQVSAPLGERTNARRFLEPILHQIYEDRYIGRFRLLPDAPSISSVRISNGSFGSEGDQEILEPRILHNELSINTDVPKDWRPDSLTLYVETVDGSVAAMSNIGAAERTSIEAYRICEYFYSWVNDSHDPLSVIEIGSRARSGMTRRHQIHPRHAYTGVDLKDGPNVDIVADVHELSAKIPPGSADAVFGLEIFEHLAMPWKAALELNKVMKIGGRAMFFTVQAWPLHEEPFDFFRFSREAWRSLFNPYTGFKIIDSAVGDPARLAGMLQTNATQEILHADCFLVSTVYVEKAAGTDLSWDVPPEAVYDGEYPA